MRFKKYKIVLLVLILVFLDQLTKVFVVQNLYDSSKELVLNIKLTYTENTGGAFGFAQSSLIGVIMANFIVLGIIIRFLYIQRDKVDIMSTISLLMILAGGFSNLFDRIYRGFVVDFIDITNYYIKFPVFNIADMLIVAGWILFAVFTLLINPVTRKIDKEILQIEGESNK